jgi:SPP1 family predicted phage head-tail adaptor
MNINKLRHKITIEENQGTVKDGGGNRLPNWVAVASNIFAEVRPVNGNEATIAERKGQQISHVVTIRYRAGIKKDKHRIVYKGRILAIEYIINKDERNIELNIQCREG